MSMTTPGRRQRADDPAVLAAAMATLPDIQDDDDVAAPTPAELASTPEYVSDTDDAPGGGAPAQTSVPAAPAQAQASTAGATGEQPVAVEPTAAAPAAPAEQGAAAPVSDPWAEYDEISYDDADTGETYVVRAPKSYAQKVKNGYSRRSVMDRTTGFMGRHRQLLEPIIANNQFDDIAPVIDMGMKDPEFARFVAEAHARRQAGLPLLVQQQAQQQAPPQQQAPANNAPSTTTAEALKAQVLAAMGDDVDDYSRDVVVRGLAPVMEQLARAEQERETFRQAQARQQQTQAQRQAQFEAERRVGQQARQLMMATYPEQFNERTPPQEWQRVIDYANQAGLVRQYGMAASTYLLAYQALQNPMGLAGIGRPQAQSVAAQTIADVQRNATAIASQAAQGVAQQVASGGSPGGSVGEAPPKKPKVPRMVKDKRTGQPRLLTPKEIGDWLAAHPEAL